MSFWDYVLPWKAIPNMVEDVKKASKTSGKGKYDSVFGAVGKYADPGGALLGDKWMDFFHGTVPREVNRAFQPFMDFNREKLDPIYRFGGKEAVGPEFKNITSTKGGDLNALAAAITFGAGALGGGAGGAGGGGSGGGGFGSSMPWNQNWGAMDWSDPSTYMNLYQQYGGMMPQGQGQQRGLGQPQVAYQPMSPIERSASDSMTFALQYGLGQPYGGGALG